MRIVFLARAQHHRDRSCEHDHIVSFRIPLDNNKQNVAIAISTDVYNHIGGVGEVGGIIGTLVSVFHIHRRD